MEQTPLPNSQHESSPTEIKILFNSEVEEQFSIKVIDENEQEIQTHSPNISDDKREISIQLPKLADGVYRIHYYFISSNDGHALQGGFLIRVGENTGLSSTEESGTELGKLSTTVPWGQGNPLEIVIFALKALYYVGLVTLIGWLIWWQTVQHYSNDIQRRFLLWGMIFQMIHLVGLISVLLIQVDIFSSKGIFFTPNFPFDTNFGLFWLVSLLLALLGFIILFKNRWVDLIWITLLVVCKSINGHASTFDFTSITVVLNSIHLIAAGIWAAGLVFIVIFWRKYKLYVMTFLPIFSTKALLCFGLMAVSGSILTFIYSPTFLLLPNDWSLILLIKLVIVGMVVVTAIMVRKKLKESNRTLGKWIVLDFTLMIVIVLIVSILTYVSPTP